MRTNFTDYLTLAQVAALFGQSYQTVRRLAAEGYYRAERPYGKTPVLIPGAEVKRLLQTPGAIRRRGFQRGAQYVD